jgi:hypothetical protein
MLLCCNSLHVNTLLFAPSGQGSATNICFYYTCNRSKKAILERSLFIFITLKSSLGLKRPMHFSWRLHRGIQRPEMQGYVLHGNFLAACRDRKCNFTFFLVTSQWPPETRSARLRLFCRPHSGLLRPEMQGYVFLATSQGPLETGNAGFLGVLAAASRGRKCRVMFFLATSRQPPETGNSGLCFSWRPRGSLQRPEMQGYVFLGDLAAASRDRKFRVMFILATVAS